MRQLTLILLSLGLTLFIGGCVKPSLKAQKEVRKVAVVSFALNDWGDNSAVRVGGDSASGGFGNSFKTQREAIQRATDQLLPKTEARLAEQWQVKKASSFVASNSYRSLTVAKTLDAYVPEVAGTPLGVFKQNSMALKKARLEADTAKALCKSLGVDAVFVIFSEWTTTTGSQVPITRPFSKNVISVWDKNGQEIFVRRVDQMGKVVIGGAGAKVSIAIPKVIEDFKDSYLKALDTILKG